MRGTGARATLRYSTVTCFRYRIRAGDACTVTEVTEDRVLLVHPDGRPRHLVPKGDIRYRLELYETRRLQIHEGERLRWTRNDTGRGLINGEEAEVRAIGKATLTLRVVGGRDLTFAHDDPQLRHVAYAYASTVHGAQGQTRERVIAVLDSGHGLLSNQQTFYVQLSRARENAVVLTDNREQLVETLEANTGERLTALEAIGKAERKAPPKAEIVPEVAASFLDRLKAERERKAAAAVARLEADLVDGWLKDAAHTLATRPPTGQQSLGSSRRRPRSPTGTSMKSGTSGSRGLSPEDGRRSGTLSSPEPWTRKWQHGSRFRGRSSSARSPRRTHVSPCASRPGGPRSGSPTGGEPPTPRTRFGPVRGMRRSRTDASSPPTRLSRTNSNAPSRRW